MALPCLKNARRIFAIVSTTSIPTSASKNHGSQCGPSVPGSRLEADHPEKGVLIACRFTGRARRNEFRSPEAACSLTQFNRQASLLHREHYATLAAHLFSFLEHRSNPPLLD